MEKKTWRTTSRALRAAHPEAEVRVWAMDEHRVGLQPTTQRTWSKVGTRPVRAVRPGYQWRYVWAWVEPSSGQLEVWLTDRVSTRLHSALLARVAQAVGASATRRVVLVLDGASWHTSGKLEVPEGLELFWLPPATPELQPAERLWSLFDEPLVGLAATSIEQVEQVLVERSQWLFEHPEVVQGRAHFHWWPIPAENRLD